MYHNFMNINAFLSFCRQLCFVLEWIQKKEGVSMKCRYCGKELPEESLFCIYCGKPTQQKPEEFAEPIDDEPVPVNELEEKEESDGA